jgi:hypothetical protein
MLSGAVAATAVPPGIRAGRFDVVAYPRPAGIRASMAPWMPPQAV